MVIHHAVFQPNLITVVVVQEKKNMIMDADVILLLMAEDADAVLQSVQRNEVNFVQSAVPDVVVVEVEDDDIKLSLQVLFFAYLSDK